MQISLMFWPLYKLRDGRPCEPLYVHDPTSVFGSEPGFAGSLKKPQFEQNYGSWEQALLATKPQYFDDIQSCSEELWDQIECVPELAGPWQQLFKQVQGLRHILSKLLHNADDAGVSESAVGVNDCVFEFEHNSKDFSRERYASLCRFGYSSKRSLHTIGFRGIGFRSTFSLGDHVELFTPSLAVAFDKKRFSEPRWSASVHAHDGKTRIRLVISDANRQDVKGRDQSLGVLPDRTQHTRQVPDIELSRFNGGIWIQSTRRPFRSRLTEIPLTLSSNMIGPPNGVSSYGDDPNNNTDAAHDDRLRTEIEEVAKDEVNLDINEQGDEEGGNA